VIAAITIPAATAAKLNDESRAGILKLLQLVAPSGKEVGETRFGELAAGQLVSIPFEGDRTVEYYVNVICDDDCVNVDLAVLDATGVEIDTDDADDNAPVLNVQADEYKSVLDKPKGIPRPMTIEVRMNDCKAETCGFGLRITQID
jgi:hypothetical protein